MSSFDQRPFNSSPVFFKIDLVLDLITLLIEAVKHLTPDLVLDPLDVAHVLSLFLGPSNFWGIPSIWPLTSEWGKKGNSPTIPHLSPGPHSARTNPGKVESQTKGQHLRQSNMDVCSVSNMCVS